MNRFEIAHLQFFMRFSSRVPTLSLLLKSNWGWHLRLVIAALAGVALIVLPTPRSFSILGWILIGMVYGIFVYFLGHARGTVRAWPLYREIIDWKKVAELGAQLRQEKQNSSAAES